MTPAAWLCPACQKHHAPHVETCPGGSAPAQPAPWPTPTVTPGCLVCGLKFDGPMGYACPNPRCPSGVTCSTFFPGASVSNTYGRVN